MNTSPQSTRPRYKRSRALFHWLLPALLLLPSVLAAERQAPCISDELTLCLLDDRVEVKARFQNQHDGGTSGDAHAMPLTDETGAFWFFNDENYEIMVKAIDGRELNDAVWIFFGSLSDVEFWMDTRDTETGFTKSYYNPPGHVFGVTDTAALRVDGVGSDCGGGDGSCPTDLFCDPNPGLCSTPGPLTVPGLPPPGQCVSVPEACIEIFDPVCGCDGTTYSNDCFRQMARVAKDHDGSCFGGGEGATCGGFAGFPCDEGLTCQFEAGSCQIADGFGVCVPRADVCPAVVDPVCGCDGKTYNNDCELLRAGVTKDHDGVCGP